MKNTTARYAEIADRIRRQIAGGQLRPGAQLPSQRELAEEYGTTLMTVRQALNGLADEGLISIEHGVGTFVSEPGVDADTLHLLSFNDTMRRQALPVETRLLETSEDVHNLNAARIFGLPATAPVCMVTRLRLLGGQPIVYQQSYLPPRLAAAVRDYSAETSLYKQLQARCGQAVTMSREVLRAVTLSHERARLLEREAGSPAFLSLRVSTAADGVPVIYDEATMAGDRFAAAVERWGRQEASRLLVLSADKADMVDLLLKNE
jgi:GntR family transcriptional regulator